MSNLDFVKGECPLCGGHLEFPTDATGQTIPCPHCGQIIELGSNRAAKLSRRQRIAIGIALLTGVTVPAIVHFGPHLHPSVSTASPPMTSPAITNTTKPVGTTPASPVAPVVKLRPGEIETNRFGINGGKMQTTSGSSLVYVLGTVRNLDDRQRFGVKIDFALFDGTGQLVGHTTDYQSEIDPRGEWDFKALVMESKAATVRFSGITEQ